MIEWTQAFETGFPTLDAQHRKLFDKIAQMTVFLDGPVIDDDKIHELIAALEAYAREHFECEERCMVEAKCAAREVNSEAHRMFLEGIARFRADYGGLKDKRESLALLQASLNGWLRNHILRVDTALRATRNV